MKLWAAFTVFILVSFPLATIWALNTLFALGIAYSLSTWAAVVWCNLAVLGGIPFIINTIMNHVNMKKISGNGVDE